MEHGINELNKLLNIFEKMSASEYLELYNKTLSMENIEIVDSFGSVIGSFKKHKKETLRNGNIKKDL